jgi:hypothetical protein
MLVLAACTSSVPDDALHLPGNGSGALECASDLDCVGAASTCCECPSFALPASSGWGSSCAPVSCAPAPSCGEVRAVCNAGACGLACNEIACDASCATGFAVDAAGCQVCGCTAGAAPECAIDADCARVAADCCGCAQGGADTAVPAGDVDAHDAMLMCPSAPACPGVDVCDPSAAPHCAGGRCTLTDAPANAALPPGACGRPDLPSCPTGLRCMLNASAETDLAGVGLCAP